MADTSTTRTSTSTSNPADLTSQMERAGHTAEGVANRMAGRGTGQGMQDVASNLNDALHTSLKEQPMATLAIAAAVGFVLGALWKT